MGGKNIYPRKNLTVENSWKTLSAFRINHKMAAVPPNIANNVRNAALTIAAGKVLAETYDRQVKRLYNRAHRFVSKTIDKGINKATSFFTQRRAVGKRRYKSYPKTTRPSYQNMPFYRRRRFRRRFRRYRRRYPRARRRYRRKWIRRRASGLHKAMRHYVEDRIVAQNVSAANGWAINQLKFYDLAQIDAYNGSGMLNHTRS